MIQFNPSDIQDRGSLLITAFIAYWGGAGLAGKIDVTQLLSTIISGVIAVAGWVLIAWLKHRWGRKRKGEEKEDAKYI